MQMKSRYGVYYDLEKSEYKCTHNGLTFVFSSQQHLNSFEKKRKQNREMINYSLSKRFKISIDVSTLADVVLYKKIETRGFLIEGQGDKMQCVKHITYAGGMMTSASSKGR